MPSDRSLPCASIMARCFSRNVSYALDVGLAGVRGGSRRQRVDSARWWLHDGRHCMRYPAGHNDAIRAKIIETASRVLRREGLDAVSIPKLMKAAGLTHGGFYVHFEDRDELVAEAVAHAANDGVFALDSVSAE